MPRPLSDRDSFVRKIERRRDAVRWVSHARHRVGLAERPSQAEVYDATFRSDAEAVSYFYALTQRSPAGFRESHLGQREDPLAVSPPSEPADEPRRRQDLRARLSALQGRGLLRVGDHRNRLDGRGARPRDPAAHASCSSAPRAAGRITSRTAAVRRHAPSWSAKLEHWNGLDYWRHAGEMHYRPLPKRWLVEELVTPGDLLVEYKFYCIHGEPVFILVISDRVGPQLQLRACSIWTGSSSISTGAAIRRPPMPLSGRRRSTR